MKRLTLTILFIIAALFEINARNQQQIEVKDYTLELKEDGNLDLDMHIDLSKLNIKTTQVVVLTPSIINANDTLMLKSVGIYGRNRKIFYLRNEEQRPTGEDDINISASKSADIIDYKITVPFLNWMEGCRVELVRTDFGCCGESSIVSRDELVDRFPIEPYYPELIYLRPEKEVVKTRAISGSAFIDFPVSKTKINPTYRNNAAELSKITGTIDSVKNANDITIKAISIKGYASPESPYSNNTRLAKGRTEALKEYVESLYHFGEDFIKTDFEAEDWAGLERYVMASSLEHKDQILGVIRSDTEPDKKEWIIKNTWNAEYKHLLNECYPALRHSDYTIEYEIRSYSTPEEIEPVLKSAPQNLSLEEFYILALTYEPGSEEFNELFETAVRMYPEDQAANLNAANSAILRKNYSAAKKYLEIAGNMPEAVYTRGVLEAYMENKDSAKTYFEEALKLGVTQAEEALREISVNRNIYTKTTNNTKNN